MHTQTHTKLDYLPMQCRSCQRTIAPDQAVIDRLRAEKKSMTAASRADCIYRCDCGVAYSNAADETKRVMIAARPELNVPDQVHAGLEDALAAAVSEVNRENKRARFCYETSEDAVTWTVFGALRQIGRLGVIAEPWQGRGEPRLLFWGGAVTARGGADSAAGALADISQSLGEDPDRRTEPDVTLVWDDLVVLVESKYRSGNDRKPGYANFDRYLDRPELFAAGAAAVKKAGWYELTRNWRIGAELAERLAARRFLLVNLGPPQLATSASAFEALVQKDDDRRFVHRTWRELLAKASPLPGWLSLFAASRGLDSR